MEQRIAVHNPTDMPIYVGSNMVPPHDTRDFPASMVPPHLRPQEEAAPAVEPEADFIADLQKLPVKEVVAALPDLSADDLARLEELEVADGSPRKSLAAAITEEKLKRASEAGTAPGGEPEA